MPISRVTASASALALAGVLAMAVVISVWASSGSALYASYPSYLVFFGIGLLRPREGYLVALILLPFDLQFAVPHAITSAPSSYTIVGVMLGLLADRDGLRALARSRAAVVIAGLCVAAAASGLATAFIRDIDVEPKLAVAEFLGLVTMSFFIVAPAALLRSREQTEHAVRAFALSAVTVLAGGALGALSTLTCIPGIDEPWPLVASGLRTSGFAPDPNLLGIYASAALTTFIFPGLLKISPVLRGMGTALLAAIVVLSGSRTGIVVGLGVASAALVAGLAFRERRTALLAALAGVVLLAGPLFAWADLPCPGTRPWEMVTYAERNDTTGYFARQTAGAVTQDAVPDAGRESTEGEIREYLAEQFARGAPSDVYTLDASRLTLWRYAFSTGLDLLPFGGGLASMPAHSLNNWRAHNTVLTVFFEQGAPGLLAIAAAMVGALAAAARVLVVAWRTRDPRQIAIVLAVATYAVGSLTQDMQRAETLWGSLGLLIVLGLSPLARSDDRSLTSSSRSPERRASAAAT